MQWGRGFSNMIYEGVIGLVWNTQGHGPTPWVAKSQLANDKGLVRKTSGSGKYVPMHDLTPPGPQAQLNDNIDNAQCMVPR